MRTIFAAGLLSIPLYLTFARLGPAGEERVPFLLLWAGLNVLYGLAVVSLLRGGRAVRGRAGSFWVLLAIAVAMRIAVFPLPASDDVYRYLWEGRLQALGGNPYLVVPLQAPETLGLDLSGDAYLPRMNHPELTTIYPPGAQLWFRAVAAVAYDDRVWKAALLLWELLLVLALVAAARRSGLSRDRLLLYLWNPLVVVAFAGEGHVDVLMLAPLWWSFVFLLGPQEEARHARGEGGDRVDASSGRPGLAGAAWGLSVACKLLTCVFLPVYLRRLGRRALVAAFLVAALLAVPYAGAGAEMFSTLLHFGQEMRHNGSIHALLLPALGSDGALRVTGGLFALVFLGAFLRRRDPLGTAFGLAASFLLLSPSVHPWYVTWLVPFFVLRPRGAWIVWTATVGFAYVAYGLRAETGVFFLPMPWRVAEYAPVFALLLFGAARRLARTRERFLRPSW